LFKAFAPVATRDQVLWRYEDSDAQNKFHLTISPEGPRKRRLPLAEWMTPPKKKEAGPLWQCTFFNDFTLKMSTVVGLQACIQNKCMFPCQWFILPSRDFNMLTIATKQ